MGATNLTPENVALQGLRFTVAFMLSFRGSPLGVIAYVDPSGAPVLLCIIANHAPNAPIRSEGGATVFAIVRLSKRVRRAGEKMTPAARPNGCPGATLP